MVTASCPVSARAGRSPEGLALVAGTSRWSWTELDRAVALTAARLRGDGVGPGDRVALLAGNHPAVVFLFFAVRRLGAALAPLNARLTPAELEPQRARLAPALVLAEEALHSKLPVATPLERWERQRATPAENAPNDVEGDWAVLFTSGTTGRPRAARLSVRAFDALAAASAANLGPRPGDRWLCNLPLFHVGGLAMAMRCVHDGATLELQLRADPEDVVRAVADRGVTHLSLVARTLQQTLDAGLRGGGLRAVLVGGGPVPPSLVRRARQAGVPVLLTYGLTEACSQVTTERPHDADGTTAGPPLPGLRVSILDAEGRVLDPGAEGTIAVHGPTRMSGYLDDEAGTAAALRGEWLLTGDLGRLDDRGRLTVLARRTDLILSGGENVYPAEVEAVLAEHPAVSEVAVVARPDARWGQVPVALVVGRRTLADGELQSWARARLAAFKVPAAVQPVDRLPRTAAGKVDRAAAQALAVPREPCASQKPDDAETRASTMRFK